MFDLAQIIAVQVIPPERRLRQAGSGSLPVDLIPSMALAISTAAARSDAALNALAERFRRLPKPVVGRIAWDRLMLDLRCLEDEAAFLGQLDGLAPTA